MKQNVILLFALAFSVVLFNGCKDDPCDSVECGANGVETESSDGESCACVCNEGFSGVNCEINDDPCNSIECGANGVATESADSESCACVCSEGFRGDSCEIEIIETTQAMLDNANVLFKSLTGMQNGMDFAHNGQPTGGSSTVRDVFTASGNVDNIAPGTVITKNTYNVAKDTLYVSYAMVKHAEGYWPESNDWEYIAMPYNATVDYTVNPNGVLANAAVSGNMHDENPGCVGCHNGASGGDQLYTNDGD